MDLDVFEKTDFMNKWQTTPAKVSNKIVNFTNDDSARKTNNTPPSIVSPTNLGGSHSVNNLNLQSKVSFKKNRPKSGFVPPDTPQLQTDRSDTESEYKTADPDYQLYILKF